MTVDVTEVALSVTVNALNIGFGTQLDDTQLSGTVTATVNGSSVDVPGTFSFTSADGIVPNGGNGQSEAVTFTPADGTDYSTVFSNVTVNVSSQATPTVSANAVNLNYGTTLANSQLSGVAIFTLRGSTVLVQGTFSYTSAAGTLLNAGNGQSVAVTFTPTDTTTYTTASTNVTVNVAQSTPTVMSVNPVSITYGTALANTQLSGHATFVVNGSTVSVPGVFTYSAAAGAVLNAGNGHTIAVTFTPTDSTDYTTANSTVTVNVAKATPIIGTVNGLNIIYGTALANSQLSGTVTSTVHGNSVAVPGTFTYTTAAGTLLNVGNGQMEAITFTPNDTTDFNTVSTTVAVNVAPFTPAVTVNDAGGIYNGSAFPATGTVTGIAGVDLDTPTNPTFLYYLATDTSFANPLGAAPKDAGNYVAVCLYAANGNYAVGAAKTNFSITPAATATTMVTSVNPAVYGQQITYTATVANTSGTAAAPAGAIQFVVDGVNTGAPVPLIASGVNGSGQLISQAVSAPINFLSGAGHSVQAVYVPSLPVPANPNFPNPDFVPSSSSLLNQAVQQIAIEGTALYIGSNGALSGDQIAINPIGTSVTGSTGVQLQTKLNGVNTTTNYNQVFSSIHIYVQNGNDQITLNPTLTANAFVFAGNGNDNIQLGQGDDCVTVGSGNDNIKAGNGDNVVAANTGVGHLSVNLGDGDNTVTATDTSMGQANVQLGNGDNTVTVGNGNDTG